MACWKEMGNRRKSPDLEEPEGREVERKGGLGALGDCGIDDSDVGRELHPEQEGERASEDFTSSFDIPQIIGHRTPSLPSSCSRA